MGRSLGIRTSPTPSLGASNDGGTDCHLTRRNHVTDQEKMAQRSLLWRSWNWLYTSWTCLASHLISEKSNEKAFKYLASCELLRSASANLRICSNNSEYYLPKKIN